MFSFFVGWLLVPRWLLESYIRCHEGVTSQSNRVVVRIVTGVQEDRVWRYESEMDGLKLIRKAPIGI